MDGIQIVNFEKYCPKCTYKKLTEQEDPCNRCLCTGAREGSNMPVEFKWGRKNDK